MECTQRLECTQDFNPESFSERSGPEQIGFLGICGNTYPVNLGPNKIGRDPQTCSIALDMKSLSRQHAVINVLNRREYMIMDLGSINKTKLGVKILHPYIPYPLRNGDTVQFGDVFGVFRQLENDADLPMTQAMTQALTQDVAIPDTPMCRGSRVGNIAACTTIPESPDVSDKDDSFIGSSQLTKDQEFKSPKSHFIKPAPKNIVKLSLGSNKINNVFWNSAQRSPSLNDSTESLNDSTTSRTTVKTAVQINESDIHEMETQAPYNHDEAADSIYTANTQLPPQVSSTSIYTLETQIPTDHLHVVNKIHDQNEMELEILVANKENDQSIYNKTTQAFVHDEIFEAESQLVVSKNDGRSIHDVNTQMVVNKDSDESIHEKNTEFVLNNDSEESIHEENTQFVFNKDPEDIHEENTQCIVNKNSKTHVILSSLETEKDDEELAKKAAGVLSDSDEKSLFDEFEDNDFKTEEEKEANKNTMAPSSSTKKETINTESDEEIQFDEIEGNDFDTSGSQALVFAGISPSGSSEIKIEQRQSSGSSSPVIVVKRHTRRLVSTSSTESEDIALLPTQCIQRRDIPEYVQINIKSENFTMNAPNAKVPEPDFEELATQIIEEDKSFDEMLTQIIEEDKVPANDSHRESKYKGNKSNEDYFEDMPTQIIESDLTENSKYTQMLFSEEIISPFKVPSISPRKYKKKSVTPYKFDTSKSVVENQPSTSYIMDENNEKHYTCTQELLEDLCSQRVEDNECVPCSVEEVEFGDRFRHIENELSPVKRPLIADRSPGSDTEENVERYVAGLTANDINDVVGVNVVPVALLAKKSTSDMSDFEVTPKKFRPLKFMNIELPDSQEIKTKITMSALSTKTESEPSESEPEEDSQELTPILFKKKKRPKINAKIDLIAKFEADALPTRVITRVRKPTSKMQDSEAQKILKPKFLAEQEENIDKDIITENITRLKNKNDKKRNVENSKTADVKKSEAKDKESNIRSETKEVITVNLISPDKKDKKTVGIPESDVTLDKENNLAEMEDTKQKKVTEPEAKKKTETLEENSNKMDLKESAKSEIKDDKKITKPRVSKKAKDNSERVFDVKEDISDCKFTRLTRSKEERQKYNKSTGRKKIAESKSISKKPAIKIKLNNYDIEEIITIDSETERDNKSKSPGKSKEPADNQQNGIRRNISPLPETDVRRSKRQRNTKDKTDSQKDIPDKPKRTSKSKNYSQNDSQDIKTRSSSRKSKDAPKLSKTNLPNDQSIIYNISAESNPSPGLKRPASEIQGPDPKRTRSGNVSSRSTPAKAVTTQHVLFTAFPSENAEIRVKLENLGAIVVSDITQCTVLVTLQIKRTFKLLCAVGLGRPIVGADWVQACADTNTIVDPWLYLMRDESAERRFQFSLRDTLVGPRGFLRGWNVSATASVTPAAAEMKLIVQSSGGTWREGGRRWLCVSHARDAAEWPALRRRGARLVTTELILGGVLRQVLDVEGNTLG